MKYKLITTTISVVFRLAIILGLIGIPSTGWGQEQIGLQTVEQSEVFSPLLISSSWLRVGPNAQSFDLVQFLAVQAAQVDQTLQIEEMLATASVLELAEQEMGVNSQVAYVVWLILRQSGIQIPAADLRKIVTILNTYELEAAWGNDIGSVQASDRVGITLPSMLNPATIAVLSALISFTASNIAIDKLRSLTWHAEFQSIFQQYFGDPLGTPDVISADVTVGFRLPFSGNNKFNGGPHGGGNIKACTIISVDDGSGIDFHAPRVIAVAEGKILAIQEGNLGGKIGKSVAILHEMSSSKVVTMYWHLASINSKLVKDMEVPQGMYIGQQGSGTSDSGFGTHLHVELRTYNSAHDYMSYSKMGSPIRWDNKPLDTYRLSIITNYDNRILNYQGTAVKGSSTPKEIKDSSVVCGTNQKIHTVVSSDYNSDVAVNDFTNTKFADPASSSELSSSNKECESNCGATNPPVPAPIPTNRSPNTPSLQDPSDWHVERTGFAPTLCWKNNGDPDGDSLQFYAEVFDSARSANNGWTSNICWRPSTLDGGYFNYQWRVKARDSRGAESGWSETRHFTIEQPNQSPTISFNSANGNGADTISSRDQTWTFTGTASDPEGKLNRVEFHCSGDSCNETKNLGANGNWSYTRDGLTGENRIWFTACDDKQCRDSDKKFTLRVDLAPPTTIADANGQTNPSGWFRGPVEVKLRAQDGATGHAAVGVREIRYRMDGGEWQSSGGDNKTITINSDGAHAVEYYAVDHQDNQETPAKRIAFQLDATPPSAPGAATETHGAGNDQWQKSVGAPEFTWGPSSDGVSGLQHYELYFGPDANSDQIQTFIAANADRRWTPLPNGVRTSAYYLRARARDNAGNYSAWSTLFTFRYDVTPPGNPTAASHAATLPSGSWQRTSASANFTWTPPEDEGSGVKGYYVYWGDQPEGKDETAGAFRTSAVYQSAGPLCAAGQTCTGYLRVRSIDQVDNLAGDWSTLFTLRYDGAAPTLDFTINGGVTQTAQTLVSLNLNATDQGSGVRDARSFAGSAWSPWEPYQTERLETIPSIGRQSWPVYVQVRDAVGWESTVISKSVHFEVNRPQPKSANFWLFDGMVNGGNGNHASSNYQGRSTIGQSMDSAPIVSPNYILRGGYQAASQALPLQVPGHDEFIFVNGVFASGIVNNTMQSTQYRMISSIGQMGLPANQTTLNSAGYQLQPGFLAAVPALQTAPTPPPTPTPGPTPTPAPPQGCEFATLSINNGALFTNNRNVTLNLCGPRAAEMKVSNDGSFASVNWEPYRASKSWTLATLGQNVIARLVQARFKDSDGLTHHYAVDDIIYDPTAPNGALAVNDPLPATLLAQLRAANGAQAASSQTTAAMDSFTVGDVTYVRRLGERLFAAPVPLLALANSNGLDVYLIAQDDNSGLAQMQLSENANDTGAGWQAYDGLVQWTPSGGDDEKQLYARFRDSAGNVSAVYSATVVIDSQPPLGGINIIEEIVGANTVSVQLYLAAEDNLSSIPAIRLSHDPTFADAPWQPFAAEITWPLQIGADENEKTIYVQFRDAAGNVSQTYSDTLLIDRQPPVMYVEVAAGETLTRQVNLYAYDELSALATMWLSNDPLLIEAVVTVSYSEAVSWTFDDRHVVWVQVDDSVGNRSEPYPAYAAGLSDTTPPPVDNRLYLPLIQR